MATVWIKTKDDETREIPAANWNIWKRRGAKRVAPPKVERAVKGKTVERAVSPKHVGGGWYEMPDGSRVRGREAAGLTGDE